MKLYNSWIKVIKITWLSLDLFLRSKLQLAFYYSLVTSFLVITFSLALYIGIYWDLEQDLRHTNQTEHFQSLATLVSSGQLPKLILAIDIGTVILAAIWGYWLAGLALKPIQENMEAQNEFISLTSHDLRTPLTVMKADLEITLKHENEITNACQRSLKVTLAEVNRMSHIVENLLVNARYKSHLKKNS